MLSMVSFVSLDLFDIAIHLITFISVNSLCVCKFGVNRSKFSLEKFGITVKTVTSDEL